MNMIIRIPVLPNRSLLKSVSQVNNALGAKLRKLKHKTGKWKRAKLVAATNSEVIYEVER